MTAAIAEQIIKLNTEMRFKRFDSGNAKNVDYFDGLFFVVGRTNKGGRFYSETVDSYERVYRIFKSYKDMIAYFGGGEVQIFCLHDNGYDVLEFSKI